MKNHFDFYVRSYRLVSQIGYKINELFAVSRPDFPVQTPWLICLCRSGKDVGNDSHDVHWRPAFHLLNMRNNHAYYCVIVRWLLFSVSSSISLCQYQHQCCTAAVIHFLDSRLQIDMSCCEWHKKTCPTVTSHGFKETLCCPVSSWSSAGGTMERWVARRQKVYWLCARRAPTWWGTARPPGTTTHSHSGRRSCSHSDLTFFFWLHILGLSQLTSFLNHVPLILYFKLFWIKKIKKKHKSCSCCLDLKHHNTLLKGKSTPVCRTVLYCF